MVCPYLVRGSDVYVACNYTPGKGKIVPHNPNMQSKKLKKPPSLQERPTLYKDSGYTIMIAVVHWLKCMYIIIVQKLTSVVEFWALLSSCWSPLPIHHCDVTYVAMCMLATTMMQPNTMPCVNERLALCESFRYSMWLIFAKSSVSYWWP